MNDRQRAFLQSQALRKDLYWKITEAAAGMQGSTSAKEMTEYYLKLTAAAAECLAAGVLDKDFDELECTYGPFGSDATEEQARALVWDINALKQAGPVGTIDTLCRFVDTRDLLTELDKAGFDTVQGLVGAGDANQVRMFANAMVTYGRKVFPKETAAA